MKKLLKLAAAACLVLCAACSTPEDVKNEKHMDLDVMKTAYTKIASIQVKEGMEPREFSATEVMYFSMFMNNIETMTVIDDTEAPEGAVWLRILTRSTEEEMAVKSPYLYVNGIWFKVSDEDLENLDRMEDITRNGVS